LIKKNLAPIFALTLIIIFFIQPNIVRSGAINGVTLWYSKILPVLFPMFILSNILLQYSFLYDVLEKVSSLSKRLLGSAFAAIPFIIGAISGYPSGALSTDLMLKSNRISKAEANYLLSFSNLCSFQFISAVIVMSMLKDLNLLIFLTLPHYVGAIVLSKFMKKDFTCLNPIKKEKLIKVVSFNEAFSTAISKSVISILTVAGVIIIFSILSEYIMSIIFLDDINYSIATASPIKQIIVALFTGILEMTNGCNITCLTSLPIEVKIIILNFLISFSGFSIVFQAISVCHNIEINLLDYIKVKFAHGIISSLIAVIMLVII
jgi:sporulation integral membrane protein YlbJ